MKLTMWFFGIWNWVAKLMQRSLKHNTKEALKCKPRFMGHSGKSLEDTDINRNAESKKPESKGFRGK